MFKLIIDERFKNKNIANILEELGVSLLKRKQILLNNLCYVNKQVLLPSDKVKLNDLLEIDLSIFDVKKYHPIPFNLTILYEDDYFIVIDKPINYIVYDLDDVKESIANFLRYYYKTYKKKCEIIPVHRLDTSTSGCLIFAKDVITAANFSRMFENDEIEKKYIALVSGVLEQTGVISKNIGKDRHINGKMVTCKNGKPATTKYKVLKSNKKLSLIEASLVTGRTHQIRVHFSSIGNPLVGDILYGSKVKNDRIMLHCKSLSFIHPITKKVVNTFSPLPEEFNII